MITRIHASLILALSAASGSHAFSRTSVGVASRPTFAISSASATAGKTSLHATHAIESEDDALWLLRKADECAHSDSCSIDDAKEYLREVVHIQSGCAAGTLSGKEACEDVATAAGVVAGLRAKIESGRSVGAFAIAMSGDAAAALSPSSTQDDLPLRVGVLALLAFYGAALITSSAFPSPVMDSVVPFTAQEWMWAIRDGYVGEMLKEFGQHGGLMQVSSSVQDGGASVVPFAAQEWLWAARDGYLGDMVSEWTKNGGFLTFASSSANQDAANVVQFTPQEWFWAMRDGYLGDMFSELSKNGGLLVADNVEPSLPLTKEEWSMAMDGGYLDDAIKHVYRNGGL